MAKSSAVTIAQRAYVRRQPMKTVPITGREQHWVSVNFRRDDEYVFGMLEFFAPEGHRQRAISLWPNYGWIKWISSGASNKRILKTTPKTHRPLPQAQL